MENENTDPSGREQRTSLLLNAPVQCVWEIWTKPDHIQHWWGPDGFTNTIEKMDVVPGGEWLFTMHAPDGTEHPNKTIFREVVRNKRLVHEHFEPNFIAIIDFESQGHKTLLTWYKLYETKELFELVELHYNSSEGFSQTVEKMNVYLTQTGF